MNKSKLVVPESAKAIMPRIKAVHPYGSKVLVEALNANEVMETNLYIDPNTKDNTHAPQAIIIELGPGIKEDSGLKVGQRVYWSGNGIAIKDPRTTNDRTRALLEVHNIQAIIEEDA